MAFLMDPRIEKILEFLERERIRATYRAVGEAIGVSAHTLGTMLGKRNPRASWVVYAATGEPAGYRPFEKHPALYEKAEIISTGHDLVQRMKQLGGNKRHPK